MNTYTVILSYTTSIDGVNTVIIYMDDTERHFNDIADAEAYRACLMEQYTGFNAQLYANDVCPAGGFDSIEWKRERAMGKLTPEEQAILGLVP